jgi:hypothetical protein
VLSTALLATLALVATSSASAAPAYDPSRQELEAVLEDLKAWLPGGWDSYPQVYLERTLRAPVEGEHEHWYRSFALIDAPQVGAVVFYGQVNVGGRDGPVLPGSQILYTAVIDEARGVVNVNGQGPVDPEAFVDLHRRPELWKQVRMRDPSKIRCDFVWRRHGTQVVGVLDGKTPERRARGPGTCSYVTDGRQDFFADAEWVLSPDALWLYDINTLQGLQFIGRKDRTHLRLYRAREYRCLVEDADGRRELGAYDRGYAFEVRGSDGRKTALMLLRADFPGPGNRGLVERLRLLAGDAASPAPTTVVAEATPGPAPPIEWRGAGAAVSCQARTGP